MNILIITNIYPPQELGGYGRSISDFAWGLKQQGHSLQVLSSDAPELGESSNIGPSGESVDRRLQLKGSYTCGVKHENDPRIRKEIDKQNFRIIRHWIKVGIWDGILVGNLDLIGPELLQVALEANCKIQHHVGFVHPPFPTSAWPASDNYQMVAASKAVRSAMVKAGMPRGNIPVIYPGARTEQFGEKNTGMPPPLPAEGSAKRPLKVCFAGLLMMSKGVHTLIEALIQINRYGTCVQASIAGDSFQQGYREGLENLIQREGLEGIVQFVGQLRRSSLARFYSLHHVGVFPSIHPEAFGIVAAEMMASGLTIVSSCVGGAKELVEDRKTGLAFEAGNSQQLADILTKLARDSESCKRLSNAGQNNVNQNFSVKQSSRLLERGFTSKYTKDIARF